MEVRELRIGNLVYFEGKYEYISSIQGDNTIRLKKSIEEKDCHGCYRINLIQPIQLNEEWLFKFGFYENRGYNPSWQLDVKLGFSIWGRVGKGFNVYVNSDEIGNPILYVHQLQNLYFELTGQELTIKQ